MECAEEGCVEFRFDDDAALREGWDMIEDQPFCPLHKAPAAHTALLKAEDDRLRERVAELRVRKNAEAAKKHLSRADYKEWDKFQASLADYHKKHGKLAPKSLRTMDPRHFLVNFRVSGPIDVELVAEALDKAEKAADETRRWLLGRIED
jgi:hypothetical protein